MACSDAVIPTSGAPALMPKDELHISRSPLLSVVRSLSQVVEESGDANQVPEQKICVITLAPAIAEDPFVMVDREDLYAMAWNTMCPR